jgi:hypothetical protein
MVTAVQNIMAGLRAATSPDRELSRYSYGLTHQGSIPGTVQTDSGAHPTFYTMSTGGSFHGDKLLKVVNIKVKTS